MASGIAFRPARKSFQANRKHRTGRHRAGMRLLNQAWSMKILMLFPYAPLPPPRDLGGTKRNRPFLVELLKRHEVSVLSYGSPDEEALFRSDLGSRCKHIIFVDRRRPRILNGIQQYFLLMTGRSHFRQIYRRKMQDAIDRIVRRERFDVIHCVTQFFGYFRFPEGIPVVSDSHEVTYDLIYRTYQHTRPGYHRLINILKYRLGRPEEIELCRKFDTLIATTERDRTVFGEELRDTPIRVIGNGVDPAFFEAQKVEPEQHSMVFTGKMDFYPNIHGITVFLDRIFPRILESFPDARITIVGAYPPKDLLRRAAANVTVTGFVDDVRPYVARAEVFIIPLWIGGGIRGKALEAMAMKKPIVSTTIGCESIRLADGESALMADSADGFADAVSRLFRHGDLRDRLARNAHDNVRRYYDWSAQGRKLEQVFETVIQQRSQQPANFRESRAPASALP